MSPRAATALLAVAAALACVLVTGWELDRTSLWLDEAFTVHDARRSVGDILAQRGEAYGGAHHPPLYFLVVKGAMAVCGTGETCVRAPSVLADAGVGALLVLVAARWFGRAGAIAVALLWPSLPYALKYAQQARHYPLFALLGVATLVVAARVLALDRPGRADDRTCVALGLFAGLTLATHLFAIPWTFALALWCSGWWLAQRRRAPDDLPRARGWLLAGVGLVVGLLPLAPGLAAMLAGLGEGELVSQRGPVENWRELVVDVTTAALDSAIVPALALVAIVLGPRRLLPLSLVLLALAPLVAVLVRNPVHFVPLRYFMPAVAITVLATAAGFAAIVGVPARVPTKWRRAATTLAAALVVAFAVPLASLHVAGLRKHFALEAFEPWRETAAWIAADARPGDALLPVPEELVRVPFEVYDPAMPVIDPSAELGAFDRVFVVASHIDDERVRLRRDALARLRREGFASTRPHDLPRSKTIEIIVFER